MQAEHKTNSSNSDSRENKLPIVVIAIILGGLLVVLGLKFANQGEAPSSNTGESGQSVISQNAPPAGAPEMILGKVVSVSANSLTITPENGGGDQTFTPSSQTVEMPGKGIPPREFNAADVVVGSRVAIQAEGTDIRAILLNYQE